MFKGVERGWGVGGGVCEWLRGVGGGGKGGDGVGKFGSLGGNICEGSKNGKGEERDENGRE